MKRKGLVNSPKTTGFTLLEAVVVLGVFGVIVGGIFALLTYSIRGFGHAVLRQGLSGESEMIQNRLVGDFEISNFGTLEVVNRETTLDGGQIVSRDAVSFVGMNDWRDPSNFLATGLPRWNRYVVYYATLEDSARLVRQLVNPGVLSAPIPYADLSKNIASSVESNANLVNSSIFSPNVLSFDVERNEPRRLLEVTLKLSRRGGAKINSGERVDETQESVFSIEAFNTYPRL